MLSFERLKCVQGGFWILSLAEGIGEMGSLPAADVELLTQLPPRKPTAIVLIAP
jgi:hypothetical protein